MKRILPLILVMIVAFTMNAQRSYVNYERDGGWNLGFNMGATWQPKEAIGGSLFKSTKPYAGFGGGVTLGKSIYEKEGAFLAFDLRGRYLGGVNYGWAGVPVFDSTLTGDATGSKFGFRNYKMTLNELSLEGVLTLNRLRERTGIILYGFGGIGATHYKVESDYKDFSGGFNNYSLVDTNASAVAIAEELKAFSDRDFETTTQDGKWSLVPSLGFGLGYQVSPVFSIGVEHKVAYDILGDEFDGGLMSNLADNNMDKYHYTAVNFRFNLLGRGETYTVNNNNNVDDWTTNNNTNTNTNITTPTPVDNNKPLVNIYNPANNNKVVHSSNYSIKAKIYHVDSPNKITFKQNGLVNSSFSFNANTDEFVAMVQLQPGNNVFEITGTNAYGADQDSRIIIYEVEQQQLQNTLPAPIVSITNPSSSPKLVSQPQFTVMSTVLNVASKNDIKFTVNGVNNSNFSYNTSNKIFTASIALNDGNNTVTVKGTNSVGSDSKSAVINYQRPQEVIPPVVNITVPSANPYTTNNPVEVINASVLNVSSKNDISVLINGASTSNFTYSSSAKKISLSANLILGANVVQVTASNTAGVDTKSTTIIYVRQNEVVLPVVDFFVPSTSPFSSQANNITLQATVLNVSGHSNIKVTFNGTPINNFSYNGVSKEVAFNVNLINGNNVFVVTGTNSSGNDQDEQIIIHKLVETPQAPIVNITNPNANPHNTTVDNQIINAEILNVNSISGVSAILNGTAVTNFTFDPVSNKFMYNATLLVGANVFAVTGTNSAGTASKTQTIIYTPQNAPCEDPTIVLSSPTVQTKTLTTGNGGSAQVSINTTNSKGAIAGQINNATNIDFKINGVSSPGYNYNSQSGKFDSYLHLDEGANTYQIIATNDCGTFIQNVTYIYTPEEAPCDNPVVSYVSPTRNPFNYTGPDVVSVTANVLGVTQSTQITLKVNNANKKFTFDSNTGMLSVNVALLDGNNKVLITATNDCGSVTEEMVINYSKPMPLPEVEITYPGNDPYSSLNPNVMLKATVINVTQQSDVQVLVDGQGVSFTFNVATKSLSANFNLAIGSHNIKVTGTNASGTAQDETEIIIEEEVQCEDPTITISQPKRLTKASHGSGDLSITTENSKGSIIAKITDATQINYTINGVASQGYNYNSVTGDFVSYLHLKKGINSYVLSVSNACGAASQKIIIEYIEEEVPCDNPVFTMINPSTQTSSLVASSTTIKGKLVGVKNSSNVSVKLNGSTNKFVYNSASQTLNIPVTLVEGVNSILINATNECGEINFPMTITKLADSGNGTIDTDDDGKPNIGGGQHSQEDVSNQQYASKIATADGLLKGKSYQKALGVYHDALSIKPNEAYPKQRILEIENIINKQKAEAAAEKQANDSYNSFIKKGDLYYNAGKYATAKTYYTKALGVKPGQSYPVNRLKNIKAKLDAPKVVKPVNTIKPNTNGGNKGTNTGSKGNGSSGTKGTGSSGSKGSNKTTTPINTGGTGKSSITPIKVEGSGSTPIGRGGK